MATLNKSIWLLLFFILLGGFLGGILGEVLRIISPAGILPDIFLKGYHVGLTPPLTIDLRLFTITLGFTFQINLLILLGIFLGIYTYKQA
ncbi:DUF4321 domain-containing protein [Nitrospira defluvii]|nr:DUF4321 domain-containing protein [Nitrospira defluvii]